MPSANPSVRVSRRTLEDLQRLREALGARTVDETIQRLIRERDSSVPNRMFGSGENRVSKFRESDRLEAHD